MAFLLSILIIEINVLYANKNKMCGHDWKNVANYDTPADRIYMIGCVEEIWDYAPTGKNLITGETIEEGATGAFHLLGNGKDRIGSKYWKGLYREYTDLCFKHQKRSAEDEHLGTLGPNIRAITGETIKVFYKNQCTFHSSIHPHGLLYEKHSEGAFYVDNDGITEGDLVPANGGKFIYIWKARNNMVDVGVSSKMWIYHSHVALAVPEINAGLFGALIITKKGMETSKTNLKPKDIDGEFTTFFMVYDENDSSLADRNLGLITDGEAVKNDPLFRSSNRMHSINGYLWGNLETLIMDKCDNIRWYTCSLGGAPGAEQDGPHSPHWHGNNVVDTFGDNTDTLVLIPGTTFTVTMLCDNAAIWLYHCHVHDHIEGGQISHYTVNKNDKKCEWPFPVDVDDGNGGTGHDDNKCNINEKCITPSDCCSDATERGIICSSMYKAGGYWINGKSNANKGCCVNHGAYCSSDDECCRRRGACVNGKCVKNKHHLLRI
eukprot:433474_1